MKLSVYITAYMKTCSDCLNQIIQSNKKYIKPEEKKKL